MATYASAKGRQLQQAQGPRQVNMNGVPLTNAALKGWHPIRPCICVTEPCPCDKLDDLDDLIVWLPAPTRSERTGKRLGSDDVFAYQIESDEPVLVEVQIPLTIAQLKQLKDWSERDESQAKHGGARSTRKALSTKDALVGAFWVGVAIGEAIDEGTGLSDTISDWAADHIPWPW
jgi:hypothetical protein